MHTKNGHLLAKSGQLWGGGISSILGPSSIHPEHLQNIFFDFDSSSTPGLGLMIQEFLEGRAVLNEKKYSRLLRTLVLQPKKLSLAGRVCQCQEEGREWGVYQTQGRHGPSKKKRDAEKKALFIDLLIYCIWGGVNGKRNGGCNLI